MHIEIRVPENLSKATMVIDGVEVDINSGAVGLLAEYTAPKLQGEGVGVYVVLDLINKLLIAQHAQDLLSERLGKQVGLWEGTMHDSFRAYRDAHEVVLTWPIRIISNPNRSR